MMPSRCRDELIIGGWSVWSAIYPLAAGHSVVASDGGKSSVAMRIVACTLPGGELSSAPLDGGYTIETMEFDEVWTLRRSTHAHTPRPCMHPPSYTHNARVCEHRGGAVSSPL